MMWNQSGILGLSPKRTSSEDDLLIGKLKKDGVISQAIFSLMVGIGRNQPSKMTLGGYDMKEFAVPGQNLKFHKIVPDSFYWMVSLQRVTLSNSSLTLGQNRNIIVDSGTSYLTMSIEDRIKLVKQLESQGLKCFFDQEVVVCTSPAFDYL
jgi:hypothetical protein